MTNAKPSITWKIVFSTVLSLTITSGITSVFLAAQQSLSDYQARILEDARATWQMGVGCIFGLLGSGSSNLLESEEDNDERDT